MKKEVLHAVNFLVDLLRINGTVLSEEQLLRFRKHAYECLWQHYQDHWFPESPQKGSGYRCIRINGKMDPLIARAGELVGLAGASLRTLFPTELTMWIDPREVAYRIGENGSICSLYVQLTGGANPGSSSSDAAKRHEEPTPVKAPAPPKKQPPPPSPQLPPAKQLQHHQHFSPSKSPSSPTQQQQQQQQQQQFHSPPRSPLFNSSQQQLSVQQQQHLAMFLMNNHSSSSSAGNCKDSLRSAALESSSRGLERLFVSS